MTDILASVLNDPTEEEVRRARDWTIKQGARQLEDLFSDNDFSLRGCAINMAAGLNMMSHLIQRSVEEGGLRACEMASLTNALLVLTIVLISTSPSEVTAG